MVPKVVEVANSLGSGNQVEVAKVIMVDKLVGSPTPVIIMSIISIMPIMSEISIMFTMSVMSITSTMSTMSVEVAILVGMVMGIARTGVIIKEGMEKENMAEVIKVLGAATAMDMAKSMVGTSPKAVEVGTAVTTSQTRRLASRGLYSILIKVKIFKF